MGWALDQDLPPRPKLVLVSIGNHANASDGYCWLRAETIAAESSCSVRSVYRTIGALMRNGYLRREKRKGADGKQRSNDYWILFNREPDAWDWRKGLAEDGRDDTEFDEPTDAETHGSEELDPQDVVEDETCDEQVLARGPHDAECTEYPPTEQQLAAGPTAMRGAVKNLEEPSKSNPENVGIKKRTPREYKPPPPRAPPPMGATTLDGTGQFIFVFVGTPAFEAWKRVKETETGRPWNQQTTKNGRWGWYFPTLFPPQAQPPPSELMTAQDVKEFEKIG